ncbi:hypothetical protein V7124_19490 [Neobacillus niacini]|uniref:hypothetical protein n=1 Tax=Neobacillus niacini TaxID=86668 RepID=UPI002FFF7C1F
MLSSVEIEKVFYQDVREKKRAGNGAFHKTGKGVKHGMSGIKFPYDYLSAKEKRKLNGAVIVSNLYTSMMELSELERYDQERQKEIVEKWREIHKAKEIIEALGVDRNQYYELLYNLGVLERPESAKPKKNPGLRKDKRTAKAEDILTYKELKSNPTEKQLEILDDYNEKYNLHSVAEIWNLDVKTLYGLRYSLRKKLGKPNIYTTSVEPKVEKQKQEVLNIEIEPKTKKINPVFLEPEPEIGGSDTEPGVVPNENQEAVEEKDELTGMNRAEIEELKQLVFAQSRAIQEIVDAQKAAAVSEVAPSVVNEVPSEVPKVVPKKSEMSFNYEDESEGFVLHQSLERFISILKKNPDKFRVEVKITRIED